VNQEPYDDLEPVPTGPPWDGPAMPADSRRIGLDRNTVEGAWIELASNLDRRKPAHLVVAILLLVVFVLPVLTTLKFVLESL
jgi:hypothetical protein